jgi:hypothetical protein
MHAIICSALLLLASHCAVRMNMKRLDEAKKLLAIRDDRSACMGRYQDKTAVQYYLIYSLPVLLSSRMGLFALN